MKFDLAKIIAMVVNTLRGLAVAFKNPASIAGIKELRELIAGINAISLLIAERFHDGVQLDDFTAFFNALTKDEEFKKKVQDAWEGHQQFKVEIKDLDVGEGMELVADQVSFVDDYVEIFKKELSAPVEEIVSEEDVVEEPLKVSPAAEDTSTEPTE